MHDEKMKLKPTGFILRCPDKTRRTFQIQPYRLENGKRKYLPHLEIESINVINKKVLAGEISLAEARMHITKIILPAVRAQFVGPEDLLIKSVISDSNMKVFRDFWSKEYRRKKLETPQTAKDELLTALRNLEPHSILSTSYETMQDHWDNKLKGTRHKRYGGRINQLLRFVGRGFELQLDRAEKPVPKWVSWQELQTILTFINDRVLRDLYIFLWGTGCRLGEAFPLSLSDLKSNDTIFIYKQLTKHLELKPYTKNRINHDTLLLPEAREGARGWLAVENKREYRKRCQKPLIEASRKAFPNNPDKWISPHKLRHSYVRYLCEKGIPLDKIKDLIGDTLKTTEDTYAGWITSSSEIDFIKQLLQKKN